MEIGQDSPLSAQGDYPVHTSINPELLLHAKALQTLFDMEKPLMVPVRPTDKGKLQFFVGDDSQEGFGVATQFSDGMVTSQEGLWGPKFAKGGLNLRKAQNQANHLLQEIQMGKHDGCKIWAATDNAVWSAVWNKGFSSARHLFDLILTLKQVRPGDTRSFCIAFTCRAKG